MRTGCAGRGFRPSAVVTVCGWVAKRREHGEHLAFIDVRDHTGIVQCVIPGTVDVRSEYVIAVAGWSDSGPRAPPIPTSPPARSNWASAR